MLPNFSCTIGSLDETIVGRFVLLRNYGAIIGILLQTLNFKTSFKINQTLNNTLTKRVGDTINVLAVFNWTICQSRLIKN